MDTVRPFVGKHSPRVKLDASEPHGIQQSRLRLAVGSPTRAASILPGSRRQGCRPSGLGTRRE